MIVSNGFLAPHAALYRVAAAVGAGKISHAVPGECSYQLMTKSLSLCMLHDRTCLLQGLTISVVLRMML
jgi:hypothetical protein